MLAGSYPVGFDVNAYYPAQVATFPSNSLIETIRLEPLFYALVWMAHSLSTADVFFLLKITGPVLYGALSLSFLVFVRRFLHFEIQKATFGTLLFILQPITLRISWDLFRNELGLSLGLLALASLRISWSHRQLLAGFLAFLAVLTHPLSAILMFVGVIGFLFGAKTNLERLKLMGALTPSSLLFLLELFFVYFVPLKLASVVTLAPDGESAAVLFGTFYSQAGFLSPAYYQAVRNAGLLFFLCYAPISFFIIKGVFREPTLAAMTMWLAICSFSFAVSPLLSIPIYWRWEILLIIPFSIYSLRGIDKIGLFQPKRQLHRTVMIAFFLALAVGYASGAFSYMGVRGVNNYAPSSMVQGSLRADQAQAALSSLTWLTSHAPDYSVLLTDERFLSYAELAGGQHLRILVHPGGPPSSDSVSAALRLKPEALFIIWDSSWYFPDFSPVRIDNGIVILQYTASR